MNHKEAGGAVEKSRFIWALHLVLELKVFTFSYLPSTLLSLCFSEKGAD